MDQKIIDQIEAVVGKDGYSVEPAVLYTYGFDASIFHKTPDMVVQPRTTEQVSEVMKIAYANRIPVVPRGAGTGLCGSAVPIKGGIVMAMQRMNRIKRISVADLWVDVEAGMVYNDLNDELAKHAWFSGDAFGVGDIAVAPFIWNLTNMGLKWTPRPHLDRWLQQLSERPAYRNAVMIPVT